MPAQHKNCHRCSASPVINKRWDPSQGPPVVKGIWCNWFRRVTVQSGQVTGCPSLLQMVYWFPGMPFEHRPAPAAGLPKTLRLWWRAQAWEMPACILQVISFSEGFRKVHRTGAYRVLSLLQSAKIIPQQDGPITESLRLEKTSKVTKSSC